MRLAALCLLFFVSFKAAEADVASAAPIARVVTMLSDLKARLDKEGNSEQGVYDKYACWCEETEARKKKEISDAKARIEELTNIILSATAGRAGGGADIEDLNRRILENEDSQRAAESLRSRESQEYATSKAEMEESIAALTKAVEVLSGAGTGKSLNKQVQLLDLVSGVRRAVQLAHSHLSSTDEAMLDAFLEEPEAEGSPFLKKRPTFKQHYAPQSTEVHGILSNMLDTFKTDLQSAIQQETDRQSQFASLMDAKRTELQQLQAQLGDQNVKFANNDATVAASKKERADLQESLRNDEIFLASTTQGCQAKAVEWSERTRLRTEETNGVSKAIAILNGEDAQAVFGRAVNSLIQTSMTKHAELVRKAVANVLAVSSKVSGDDRVSLLVTKARTDPFEVVTKEINKLLEVLKEEEQLDFNHKDWCDHEENGGADKKDTLQYNIKKLNEKLDAQNKDRAQILADIHATEQSRVDLDDSMKKLGEQRDAGHNAYNQAKKDDSDALALINKAKDALLAFYKSNGVDINASLLQKSEPHYSHRAVLKLLSKGDPKATQDKAPEGKFSEAGKKLETKQVLSALEMVRQDIEASGKAADQEEARAQADFVKLQNEATATRDQLHRRLIDQKQQLARKDTDIVLTNTDKSANEQEHADTDAYLESIKPSCQWIGGSFQERLTRRKAEIEGLKRALGILRGASAGNEFEFTQQDVEEDKKAAQAAAARTTSFLSLRATAKRQ